VISLFNVTNSPRSHISHISSLFNKRANTQEAYGFVGIVASALLFLFHLLLLFSPPLNEEEEEEERHQKEEESALIRFVSFSKHHAKALPLWTTLCVILYVVLVESSSRMKVYDLRDGRLLAREEEKKKKREKKKSNDESAFVVGRQSASASAWNEALFSGKKKGSLP
jgi:hypothetical protein